MLIGFCGKRTAGKTHSANLLIADYGFARAKFAEAIKSTARDAFLLTVEHTDGKLKELPCVELGGKSPRDAMEWLGEGARQMFGEDVWVRRWFDTHHDELILGTRFVFDDVRNPCEANAIRKAGGKVIRIFNQEADALPILPSEQQLAQVEFDFGLVNFGDERFDENVRNLLQGMGVLRPWDGAAIARSDAPMTLDPRKPLNGAHGA